MINQNFCENIKQVIYNKLYIFLNIIYICILIIFEDDTNNTSIIDKNNTKTNAYMVNYKFYSDSWKW